MQNVRKRTSYSHPHTPQKRKGYKLRQTAAHKLYTLAAVKLLHFHIIFLLVVAASFLKSIKLGPYGGLLGRGLLLIYINR